MDTTSLDFKFKGSRTYVHGTDIYNAIIEYAREKMGLEDISNIRYTLHKVMRTNLDMEIYINERVPKKPETAVVFLCESGGAKYQFMLHENHREITGRYEYDEDGIVKDCLLNREGQLLELTDKTPYSDIELIVAINKAMMNLLFPDGPGKWYFTKLELEKAVGKTDYSSIKTRLIRNLNFKLTKSEVFIDGVLRGYIYFSSAV